MNNQNRGVYITNNPANVAKWLQDGKPAVLPFGGGRMFGLFSSLEPKALERMARMKGRAENKPFVITTHSCYVNNIVLHGGISKSLTKHTKDKITKLLEKTSERHSIGILLPADNSAILHKRLIGNNPKINGFSAKHTIGFMLSGQDEHYHAIVSAMSKDNYFIAGTSMNRSGDEKSRGSGHHKLGGVISHFGHEQDLCIYYPKTLQEGDGTSTTILYVENEQEVYVVRIGSLTKNELTNAVKFVGFKEIKESQVGAKHILPYNYNLGGKLFSWYLKKHIHRKMKKDEQYFWNYSSRLHKLATKII